MSETMDSSGDTHIYPAIKLDTSIYVDSNGEITEEESETCIRKVIRVINGSIDDVSHLIGHSEKDTTELLIDNELLESTPEVNAKLRDTLRVPASYLVLEESGQLFGVVVDCNGELNIVGVVEHVIPAELSVSDNSDNYCKVAVFAKNGYKFCKPSDIDLRAKIETGSVFGLVSLGGYVFIPVNAKSYPEMPDLVLILQNGYFLIEDDCVKWTRLKTGTRKDEVETRTTTIEKGESIVTSCGGCVRSSDGFEIFGSQTAIFAFSTLLDFLVSMQTIGFEKQTYSQPNVTELENDDNDDDNEEDSEEDDEQYDEQYENEDICQQTIDLEKESESVESYCQQNEEQFSAESTQIEKMDDMCEYCVHNEDISEQRDMDEQNDDLINENNEDLVDEQNEDLLDEENEDLVDEKNLELLDEENEDLLDEENVDLMPKE